MDALPLNEVEARVLGALIEKEITTPEYYPLSLHALTTACNQINNRDPVVTYAEPEVLRAIESLRDKHLAYALTGAVHRVVKYGHKAAEVFELPPPELALVCTLLLRGPQTVGELRGRTGRMHPFADLDAVAAVLQGLATRPQPLVACLPRQSGTKEPRYAHLLAGAAPEATPAAAAPPEDRVARLEGELADLRRELAGLRAEFAEFRRQFD